MAPDAPDAAAEDGCGLPRPAPGGAAEGRVAPRAGSPLPRRAVVRLPTLAGGTAGAVLGLLAGVTVAEAPPWATGPGARIRPGTVPPSIAASPAAVIGGDRVLPPGTPVTCPAAVLAAAPGRPAHRDPRCADRPGTDVGRKEGRRR